MDTELQAIRDAFDKDTGNGRDETATRELAGQYVEAHPDKFDQMRAMTQPELVTAVEKFREAGMEQYEWEAQAFLFATYPPQTIGGTLGQEN